MFKVRKRFKEEINKSKDRDPPTGIINKIKLAWFWYIHILTQKVQRKSKKNVKKRIKKRLSKKKKKNAVKSFR